MKKILLVFLLMTNSLYAKNYLDENLQTLNWDGIKVVWLEDDTLPTYDVVVYYNQGARLDPKGQEGLTEMMFNLVTTGTLTRTQGDILEFLEFFGASYGASVTHEFSTFELSGLTKDIIPTTKLVCELLSGTVYPKREVEQNKKRIVHSLKNLVTNPGALASRIFRELSLKHTPFDRPVGGTVRSISKINSNALKTHRELFNNKVQKTIYLRGSKKVLSLKSVFKNDCEWKKVEKSIAVKKVNFNENTYENKIVFVPVPSSNQAQVRIGKTLDNKEIKTSDAVRTFASSLMGAGFTSMLMQRLRVEKGLTYSVNAYASAQKLYGRAGINTFTKNETIVELLENIKDVIKTNSQTLDDKVVNQFKKNITGNYLFSLESSSGFLRKLVYLDHRGEDYEEIYEFTPDVLALDGDEVKKEIKNLFEFSKQVVVIVGDSALVKKLRKAGYKVELKDYKEFI